MRDRIVIVDISTKKFKALSYKQYDNSNLLQVVVTDNKEIVDISNCIADVIPIFNDDFTYTYEDTVEDSVTTRTIKSPSLPTRIQFGSIGTTPGTTPLLEVISVNTSNLTTMEKMFNGCSQLTQLNISNWDTSNVKSMHYMFQNCSQLTQLDVSNWDTSSVTSMNEIFQNCSNLRKIKILNTIFPHLLDFLPARTTDNPGYLFSYEDIPNEKNWNSYICKDYKIEIPLSQQLMKIGDVEDRLYWDVEKKHYCIEKKIGNDYTILATSEIIDLPHLNEPLKLFQKDITSIMVLNSNIKPSKTTINYKDIQDYK